MPEPVVLVLGCGVGGVVAARFARDLLPQDFRVVVIDREAEATQPASLLWLMTGERRPEAITRHRGRLARRGIEFVHAEVHRVDFANRYVRADSREFRYDFLVLALGAEAAPEAAKGVGEAAHAFYPLDSAERLAASLRYFAGGRVVIAADAGSARDPIAPYEAAMLLEHYFHARRIRQKVEIHLCTSEPLPLQSAGLAVSEALMGLLAHRGIELHCGARLVAADAQRREASFADGTSLAFQLLVSSPERRLPDVVREAGLATNGHWVHVNPSTLETSQPNVFALGDLISLPLPDGSVLPGFTPFVQRQGEHVARQIAYRAGDAPYPDPLDGKLRYFVEAGGGSAAVIEGDFLAPRRSVSFRQPALHWHWANLARERYWLWRWY